MNPGRQNWFTTTQWTMIQAAADLSDTDARNALNSLCEKYWYPLFAFARWQGRDEESARDLTQGFFSLFLERNFLAFADPERGRFRSFLLTAFKNFIHNEWDKERALKRGGDLKFVPLERERAEGVFRIEPVDNRTPEQIYDQEWALTAIHRAIRSLESEMENADCGDRFRALKGYLTGEGDERKYRELAGELDVSETAVKVMVHRLRRRLGQLLRLEIANTVSTQEEIESEIRYLLVCLKGV